MQISKILVIMVAFCASLAFAQFDEDESGGDSACGFMEVGAYGFGQAVAEFGEPDVEIARA